MLKGLDPLLGPELLATLRGMGHGDEIAIVDGNYPGVEHARRLIRLDGHHLIPVLDAMLSVLPIDDFEPEPIRRMLVVGDAAAVPAVQEEVEAVVAASQAAPTPLPGIERFAFYEAARKAFGVVQVGDARPYGCFLLRKGVIAG